MFTFAWPYLLLLLPIWFIFQKVRPIKIKHHALMLRVPILPRIESFSQTTHLINAVNPLTHFYAFCSWSLIIFACANPQWLGEPLSLPQTGRNIMLAVDLSPSMSIPDLQQGNQYINRLESVKTVAAKFIEKREGDKLGLILFGSKAYLQTPLTFDRQTVRSMLDDATLGLAGNQTAIGDALGLAIKKFTTENIKSRVLILLTDGANNAGVVDPMEAAELAKQNQIKIYTIGIGASSLEINTGFSLQKINPAADLDEDLLKNIATKTQGQYFRAEDQNALDNILEAINQLEPVSAETKSARPITSLFYIPLAGALFFLTLLLLSTFKLKLRR